MLLIYLLSGIIAWTLLEYLVHRFVFHALPWPAPLFKLFQKIPYLHHTDPSNEQYMFVPLIYPTLWVGLILGGYYFNYPAVTTIVFGVFIGYAIYEIDHYKTHKCNFDNKWIKYMREYHTSHHKDNPNIRFGITSPLWDYVFGTYK